MRRGVLLVVALGAMLWPAAGQAADDPTTTTVPDTTVPDTTVPPPTTAVPAPPPTVVEAPPTTLPAEPAVPLEGRTLTVTPRTNLVHGQDVVVRGTGWPANYGGMGAAQCHEGATGVNGCGPITYFSTNATGSFRSDFEVEVIIDTEDGTYDCRTTVCVIGANSTPSASGARFVELTFDPAGPDPTRRTATVTPDTGLVDGQQVTVEGDGFTVLEPGFGGVAEAILCRLPATRDDCDPGTREELHVDDSGHLRDRFRVRTVLLPEGGGTHDCRTGGCALLVGDYDKSNAESALVPVAFDPAGALLPPPTITVDPTTDLVDGDVVAVTGEDFDPFAFVLLIQCQAGATDYDQCGTDTIGYAKANGAGEFETVLSVRAILERYTGSVDCRIDPCSVLALPDDYFPRAIEVPVTFDPAGPLLEPTISVTPSTGLQDGDLVDVEGEQGRPGAYVQLVQCLANAVDNLACDGATRDYQYVPNPGGDFVFFRSAGQPEAGRAFVSTFTVRRVLHLFDGRTVDCARRPCALVVAEELASVRGAHRVALDFAPAVVDPIGATPTFTG